jgi:hypothetical protein
MICYGAIGGESGYWRIRPDGTELESIDGEAVVQLTASVSPNGEWTAYWKGGELWTEHLSDSESAMIYVLEEVELPFPPEWVPDSQGLLLLSLDWTAQTFVMRRTSLDGAKVERYSRYPSVCQTSPGSTPPASNLVAGSSVGLNPATDAVA